MSAERVQVAPTEVEAPAQQGSIYSRHVAAAVYAALGASVLMLTFRLGWIAALIGVAALGLSVVLVPQLRQMYREAGKGSASDRQRVFNLVGSLVIGVLLFVAPGTSWGGFAFAVAGPVVALLMYLSLAPRGR